MDQSRFEVQIYQIADDSMLKQNRQDGTGWEWSWADWQRDWMNATPHRYAYRCLPLTIANQTGWWIKNPVGFTATWRGPNAPGSIEFTFDTAAEVWSTWINSQFGEGIITWNTPFLFRTQPSGSRLLVCGPANYFKRNAHALTAIIESDWISMSFTMNWKIMVPHQPVRFEQGEPLFQAIPLLSNLCADLEEADVSYQRLSDNPELHRAYMEWDQGRRRFHDQKAAGEVKATEWQKDYFQGRDASGREVSGYHMTKIKPPTVRGLPEPAPVAPSISTSNPSPTVPIVRIGRPASREPARAVTSVENPRTLSIDEVLEATYSQNNVVMAMMDQVVDAPSAIDATGSPPVVPKKKGARAARLTTAARPAGVTD